MLVDVAMRHLPERMHAGIGAARAMHTHIGAAGRLDRSLECALHRRMIGLKLPAGKRRAVIFDGELVAGHPSRLLQSVESGSVYDRSCLWGQLGQGQCLEMASGIGTIERGSRGNRIIEATIIGGVAQDKDDGFTQAAKNSVSGLYKRGTDTGTSMVHPDREGRKADTRQAVPDP